MTLDYKYDRDRFVRLQENDTELKIRRVFDETGKLRNLHAMKMARKCVAVQTKALCNSFYTSGKENRR